MGRNRSVAGKSYEVDYRSSSDVLVTFTYRCPYCGEETMAPFLICKINEPFWNL